MRHQLFCTAAFAVTLLLAAHAEAQPAPQAQDCTGKSGVDWNQQVKACTALIEAAQGSPQDRAKIYDRRASVYFALGDDDHAMADYDAAIRLDPDLASAYGGRGDIYIMDREDPDRAIAEYNQALQHDTKYVDAYLGRSSATIKRAISIVPSPTRTRQFGSIPNPPAPSKHAVKHTRTGETSIAPLPITMRRSASIQRRPTPTTLGGSPTWRRAISRAPSLHSARPSGLIHRR
jgi:tetratricopeptide (TPR) repeat protein